MTAATLGNVPVKKLELRRARCYVRGLEFGILGPLAVWKDGRELPLGGAKQRGLLAVLLLRPNELVPTARLIDELWGERPPATAVKAVQIHVSRLRKLFGEGVLETGRNGYVLRVELSRLDSHRFEALLEQGSRMLASGDAAEASRVTRKALALWRGPALADFEYESFARNESGRLEELRMVALEQRLEADLGVGRAAEVVGELEALVRDHPLRERLRGLLMLALYRSGRQADALAAYQNARATLVDELGLEPSESLQQLERAILLHAAGPDLPSATLILPAPAEPPPTSAPAPAAREVRAQRKIVTVLFADVAGSTALGEQLDAEALRSLLAAYFARMKTVSEQHGGIVEKFVGDAVMAVFGLPAVHEDDAVRALRAAREMLDCFRDLGLEGRIGVESGEVIVGTPERLVTGDPVNVAARLQQSAAEGEILVGPGTISFAREQVVADELGPLELRGRRKPVPAWRLVSVSAGPRARSFDSPLVGRSHDLRALAEAWERARTRTRCELATVLGAAGIGKSRLVAEFAARTEAEFVSGRCLSYGTGITYWPVVEMLTQLRSQLGGVAPEIAGPLTSLLAGGGAVTTDELAWAFRKLVEHVAREQPLVLVFDDIQWAEDALLDLVEHVQYASAGAPILVICMARPDLLDRRPGWSGVRRLEPLTPEETEQLVEARLGERGADATSLHQIAALSAGNPLFVEELVAMLRDSDRAELALPPTIQALLSARLDQLEPGERTVLEAGAVEGEVFHRGAVEALTEREPGLTTRLTSLIRKELIRPERAELDGEDAFRFRHLLIRDAAYDAVPKAARSGLHERYAAWIDERANGADAFVGYHLEQAYRYRTDLRETGAEVNALARQASERLQRAASVAFGRNDFGAATSLLERAADLTPVDDVRRAHVLADLAETLMAKGELVDAGRALDGARALSTVADEHVGARLVVEQRFLEAHRGSAGGTEDVHELIKRVLPIFERAQDTRGLCRAWQLQASAEWTVGRVSAAAEAWERAAEHARRAAADHERAVILCWLASSAFAGSTPVDEGIRRCEELGLEVHGHPAAEAEVLRPLAGFHGFAGRFDVARELFLRRRAALEDLGRGMHYVPSNTEGIIEMLAGEFGAAEERLRTAYEILETMHESSVRSTTAGLLARAVLAQGRHEEAEELCDTSERLADPDDVLTHIVSRGVRARILVARGRGDEAERTAREGVGLARRTELVNVHGDALADLAWVLDAAGRAAEASAITADAVRLYEAKGNAVAALATRARLHRLAPA